MKQATEILKHCPTTRQNTKRDMRTLLYSRYIFFFFWGTFLLLRYFRRSARIFRRVSLPPQMTRLVLLIENSTVVLPGRNNIKCAPFRGLGSAVGVPCIPFVRCCNRVVRIAYTQLFKTRPRGSCMRR